MTVVTIAIMVVCMGIMRIVVVLRLVALVACGVPGCVVHDIKMV